MSINRDFINGLLVAVMAAGVLLALFGGYMVVNASLALEDNYAQILRESGVETEADSAAVPGLVSADLARRELERQRSSGLMLMGGGLVLLAGGWITHDFLRGRGKKRETPPAGVV